MASRSGAVTGAIFVVSLTLLLFLFNGDLSALTVIYAGIAQYQGYISQSLAYVAILGFGIIAMKSEGISWKDIGTSRGDLMAALPVLAALGVATVAVAALNGDLAAALQQSGSGSYPAVFLGAICFASFVEEYVFRGYVQNGTAKRFGVTMGILVSAVVFSLAHVPTDLNGLDLSAGLLAVFQYLAYSAVGRFFFGVLAFSTLYYLTGNFFLSFFTHVFYDISVFFLAPPDGSFIYRSLYLVIPYVAAFTLFGRYGLPPLRGKGALGTPDKQSSGGVAARRRMNLR